MNTKLAAVGTTLALATALAGLGGGHASAANTDCDPNAPGSCDAYKPDDPFVPGGNKVSAAPPKTIVMADFAFTPTKITAAPGEMWTEDNRDVATHNLSTASKGNARGKNGDIAPDVMAGQKAKFKMPTKKGKYKVVCYYHQNMTATITVK
jgi:plastocyanin